MDIGAAVRSAAQQARYIRATCWLLTVVLRSSARAAPRSRQDRNTVARRDHEGPSAGSAFAGLLRCER